jgi:hypothetical protein
MPIEVQLRAAQFRLALDGNTAMLIWLGKQYLGQTDKHETKNEHTGKDGAAISFTLALGSAGVTP